MVEGPGCKLKGEKIKAKLVGRVVKTVAGNAVEREIKPTKGIEVSQFHQLIGLKLEDVQTLGKELFMYFGEICLRVHFLMAGSFLVNGQKLDKDFGGNAETASLELQLSNDKLSFYKSSVMIRSSELCRNKYDNLNELDICSPKFNQKRAVALVMEQKGRQLCDVLLDQEILPGVGNIIKNEALFDSGIKPSSKVEELKQEHISHLVKMTRDFSMIFYKCRRDGTPLQKFMKIYKKGKCTQCHGKVTICRLGDDSERVTYFCETCQNNDLKTNQKRTLPVKNSLLGWVKTTDSEDVKEEEWSCSVCTLINKSKQLSCSVCGSVRVPINSSIHTQVQPEQSNARTLVHNNILSSEIPGKVLTPSLKRKLPENLMQQPTSATKRSRTTQNNGKQVTEKSEVQSEVTCKIPACPGHNKKCSMVEVHKKGANYGRWFFTCSEKRSKQCKFFEWADEHFPICMGHGKPCTIRTVMKQGPNNGKKFFTCAKPKHKQCQYFEWAVGYD